MRRRSSMSALALAAMAWFAAPPAVRAQSMVQLQDIREVSADVTFMGMTKSDFQYPPAPFATWEKLVGIQIDNPDPEGAGSCGASAYQYSEFIGNGIYATGATGAGWQIIPGDYNALSYAFFQFRVDTCIEYHLDAWLDPGDLGERYIKLDGSGLSYESLDVGEIHQVGRLPAGTYELEGRSYIQGSYENATGPTFTIMWTCTPIFTTLVRGQPSDRTIGCGGTATFNVTTNPSPSTLTFQWRRNLVPLANGPGVAGATTQTLTLSNVCTADAGYYDVVLSDGTVVEPSRLARLDVNTATGVEVADSPQPAFSVTVAGPNPFGSETSFRYAAARPTFARIAIYGARGDLVRTLIARTVDGTETMVWDGRTDAGARAPAGIYFLRTEAGSVRESRKLVLLR